ncbi:hypothetical protein FPQ18DRAFT_329636 [Pyronema domesticum]|nr:hypothetical protein FPQ18DRAFT_329636 [Pyronema domesticum]
MVVEDFSISFFWCWALGSVVQCSESSARVFAVRCVGEIFFRFGLFYGIMCGQCSVGESVFRGLSSRDDVWPPGFEREGGVEI